MTVVWAQETLERLHRGAGHWLKLADTRRPFQHSRAPAATSKFERSFRLFEFDGHFANPGVATTTIASTLTRAENPRSVEVALLEQLLDARIRHESDLAELASQRVAVDVIDHQHKHPGLVDFGA
ncbi:hypothetical protein OKW43_005937 [Paraburkholderia sp. WC7.3g]|uniref:hypothetical protein n=1 Tax=Paraburkholderia sp. WC7.3g TaxID=2991070 RepID=UPI003D220083